MRSRREGRARCLGTPPPNPRKESAHRLSFLSHPLANSCLNLPIASSNNHLPGVYQAADLGKPRQVRLSGEGHSGGTCWQPSSQLRDAPGELKARPETSQGRWHLSPVREKLGQASVTGVNTCASDRIVHLALKAQVLIPTAICPQRTEGCSVRDTLRSLQGEWTPPGLTGGEGLPQERWWAHRLLLTESTWQNVQTLQGAAGMAMGPGGCLSQPHRVADMLGLQSQQSQPEAPAPPSRPQFLQL